jgi:proteasome-associated ATPase
VVDGRIDQWHPGTRLLLTGDGFIVGSTVDCPYGTSQGYVAEVTDNYALVDTPGDSHGKVVCAYDGGMKPPLAVGDEVMLSTSPPVILSRMSQKKETRYMLEKAPSITFAQIGGHDGVTGEIVRDLELHLLHAEKLLAFDLRPISGITLHGKPGTGKTMMAKALANHLSKKHRGTKFLSVDPGILRGWLYGQTEHNIRELFTAARSCEGYCVMFFDELDNFGTRSDSTESGIDSRVLGTLLSELDGLRTKNDKILVVGATNRLDLCDGALVRQGRFGDRVYEIPRPNHDATQAILKLYLHKKLPYSSCTQAECTKAISKCFFSAEKPVLRVTTQKDEKFDVSPEAIISGAILETIVQNAKRAAADRFIRGVDPLGIVVDDCTEAASAAIYAEAGKLTEPHAARMALGTYQGQHITAVETV